MTFKLDTSIFAQGAANKNAQQKGFFDQLARGIGNFQQAQAMKTKKQQLEADPKNRLRAIINKKNQGQELSPEEIAFVNTESQIQGQKMGFDPLTQQPYSMPTLSERVGISGKPDTFNQLVGASGYPVESLPPEQSAETGFNVDQFFPNTGMEATPAGRMQTFKTNENIREKKAATATKAEEKLNEAFIKDVLVPYQMGGSADSSKQIEQISEVIEKLKNEDITGGIKGYVPPIVRGAFDESSVDAQEKVEEVVQRNLREVLGAQFTEKEGTRLINRAYNPRLDEAVNQKRLEALKKSMIEAAESKQSAIKHFEKNGTLSGWKGKMPTYADIEKRFDELSVDNKQSNQKSKPSKEQALEILRKRGLVK